MPGGANDFTDGNIYVDFNRSNNAIEDLRVQTNQVQAWLQQLNQELQALKASWVGDDADVYQKKQEAWNRAADAMGKLLTSHAGVLQDVSQAFDQNQKRSAQGWDGVRIGA
ncbi:WXG100 family type VII secretion target [Streptomyces lydicus]|uniref:WXG100 family type VII secretion target n=1 Tax=Streptomyces lydicus TaxID=47763 RepID=UPI0036AFA7DF